MERTSTERQVPLAIIGISCLFPKAQNLDEFWANIRKGVDAISEIPPTHWAVDDYFSSDPKAPDRTYARRGGFLSPVEFDPLEFGISPANLEAIDTSQLLGLVAAKRALEDAGYGTDRQFDRSRVGCILGVTGTLELVIPLGARLGHPRWRRALKEAGVPDDVANEVVERISESYVPWQENSFPGLLGNVVAGRIANRLDLGGTNCVVDAACASSLSALHLATLELTTGRSDLVLTGGVDTFNDIFMYMCFSKTPALSPTGDARPFAADADGTMLGEGVGMLVLKRLADAERDGDRIYAAIRGIGTSSDGQGNAVYAPKADGQVRCIQNAYQVAGVTPETIELVEAHGTGTKVGDATEVAGLTQVYGTGDRVRPWCALGSVKSQLGHTKAAAGVAGIIKATMALYHRVLPPTIKVQQPTDALTDSQSPFYLSREPRPWIASDTHPRRAAVSAFGFGGSNFHCVLEEAPATEREPDWDGDVQILSFSAPTAEDLKRQLADWNVPATWSDLRTQASQSRHSFDRTAEYRLQIVVERGETDLAKVLADARAMLERSPSKSFWSTPDGAHFGRGRPGRLGIVFPGQGSQYVGMLRDLACHFPRMQEVLAEANAVFARTTETLRGCSLRLSDAIFPPSVFREELRAEQDRRLRATENAQPAIGAVSLGALTVLEQFGVKAEAVAGHSYGELTALCASRRFEPAVLYRLSKLRGELMAESNGDDGAMLAITAPAELVERALSEEAFDLVIANRNSPSQVVLSGRCREIDRAAESFARRNIRGKRLQVSAAFHSPLVAPASERFRPYLEEVAFAEPQVPVFANTSAEEYPADPVAARNLLAGQLARPVNWVSEVENMYRAGVRTFLEVGPGATLTGLIDSILAGREHKALAIDASAGRRSGIVDLAHALAQLAALGHEVDLTQWDPNGAISRPAKKSSLTIPICGANYVKPRPPRPPRTAMPMNMPQNGQRSESRIQNSEFRSENGASRQTADPSGSSRATDHSAFSTQHSAPSAEDSGLRNQDSGPGPADSSFSDAFRLTQENLLALQRMQAETAQLHRTFLEGQQAALRAFQSLAERGQELLAGRMAGSGERKAESKEPERPPVPRLNPQPSTLDKLSTESGERRVESGEPVALPSQPLDAQVSTLNSSMDELATIVLQVVAEKTGYPVEMLNVEMSLDHDLGIDSIKRVEILSALQERLPNAPAVKPDELGTLRTLRDVVAVIGSPVTATAEVPVGSDRLPDGGATAVDANDDLASLVLQVVAEKTGYPAEMLNLEMSLDHDLGIDSIKRVEILSALQERCSDLPAVQPEELGTLHTLRDVVAVVQPGGARRASIEQTNHRRDAGATAADGPLADDLAAVLLQTVAEKTGYPADILNLDMSLDHDLGIDSIKRVEILSALQERLPQAPVAKPDELGSLRTLSDILALLRDEAAATTRQSGGQRAKSGEPETPTDCGPSACFPPTPQPSTPDSCNTLTRGVVEPVALVDNSRPAVRLREGADIWITDDGSELSLRIAKRLHSLGYRPRVVSLQEPAMAPASLDGLVLIAPSEGTTDRALQQAFHWLQTTGPALKQAAADRGAVFVTVARLDGAFGFAQRPPRDPLSGGLAGLTKTVRHEWPNIQCKAVDLAEDFASPTAAAQAVVEELLQVGPIEVGLSASGRVALQTTAAPLGESSTLPLNPGDLVVVSGGGRGVTAEAAIALAQTCRPTLALLGRSPEPQPEADWLRPLSSEAEIKRALLSRAAPGTTPKLIEQESRRILADREVRTTIARVRETGAEVEYCAVDVRDAEQVRSTVESLTRRWGPVRGVIHGAGVLADQRIEDKTPEQFERVYSTKIDGLRNLLAAVEPDELRCLALFSSFTGRYGRTGQVDYAVANEVLNKLAQQHARRYPHCRTVAFNWGPWDGGMVTPSLRKLFAAEGIGLIPLQDGARFLVHELAQPTGPAEVLVIGGELPVVPNTASVTRADGLPTDADAEVVDLGAPTMIPADHKQAFERRLDVEQAPVLQSHVIGGKAVVPMALVLEWLAHGALHGNPGLELAGLDELRIFKGVRLDADESVAVRVLAGKAVRRDGEFVVPVKLFGKHGERDVLHAGAEAILTTRHANAPQPSLSLDHRPWPHAHETIYRDLLFHGPELQGIEQIECCTADGISGLVRSAPLPSAWLREPLRGLWLTDPLVLDCAFQLMTLWCREVHGVPSLPTRVGSYRQFRRTYPNDGLRVVARVRQQSRHQAIADLEILDRQAAIVARLDGYECVLDGSLTEAFRRNRL